MKRNYPLLLASQFLSAFADNAILMLILGPLMIAFSEHRISAEGQSVANIFYTSLLFVPYVLLAPLAGFLNDRFPKTFLLAVGNGVKLIGSLVTAIGISHGQLWEAIGYFLVGIGACLYSPAKYGILPEILPRERLVKANGTMEMLTMIAILLGSIAGAKLFDRVALKVDYAIVIAIYGGSMLLNFFMTRTPANPEIRASHSIVEFGQNIRGLFSDKRLARILVGTSLFWICGAMMKMNFQPWGQQVLHLTTMTQINLLGLWLSIGLIVGSVFAGKLYRTGDLHATRGYGWLLAATIGLLSATNWFLAHQLVSMRPFVITVLIVAGIIAGLFLIPLNAALQAESHQDKLGKTIATQNLFENLAMLAGSIFAYANVKVGFDPSQLFMGLATLVFVVVCFLEIPVRKNSSHENVPALSA
jgi:LPLT family lysophospholipid transporter-like MFS transporter